MNMRESSGPAAYFGISMAIQREGCVYGLVQKFYKCPPFIRAMFEMSGASTSPGFLHNFVMQRSEFAVINLALETDYVDCIS